MLEDNSTENTERYADAKLSEEEQAMQKFLEETYGLTRDEYVSIVLWLDNFSLRFDDIARFEKVEDSLSKDFGLTSNDIYSILFSHGDVFCHDYSKTQSDFEVLNKRFNISRKDFAKMLKDGCVIDKEQIESINAGLSGVFSGKKHSRMASVLKNTIEYYNFDYVQDIEYKLVLLEIFGVTVDDIENQYGFLRIPAEDFLTRLKLMSLTNELPSSFLNVGHRTPNSKVYKLFLQFQSDAEFKRKGHKGDYLSMRKTAERFDDSVVLSKENIKDIDSHFARRFPKIKNAINLLQRELKSSAVSHEELGQETQVLENQQADAIESGKQISYIKNDDVQVSKSATVPSVVASEQNGFVNIDPIHKKVWTYMVKNFGLTYQEYPGIKKRINDSKKSRLEQPESDIEAVFADVESDFHITRKDFGQFFKYTLYGMEQRLALLECFGVTIDDLRRNDYQNASVLDIPYEQLEYMLKVASIGKVDLDENLWRLSKYTKDFFLAKYIKFSESGEGETMLDTPVNDAEYQDMIRYRVPVYRKGRIIESKYASTFPVANSFLNGYNENQRNLLMIIGLLVKRYGYAYPDAKEIVQASTENFNMHTKIIQARLSELSALGFNPETVIENSGILRVPEEKAIPRAVLAKYLGLDEKSFLKNYLSTSAARVYARMMGAMDIKPSYYYAGEKVFSGLTGLSTEDLMQKFTLGADELNGLKKKVYEAEKLRSIELMVEDTPSVKILTDERKQLEYTPQEIKFREFMLQNYGINAFAFNGARYIIGAKGLNFLTVEQAEKVIEVLKTELELEDREFHDLFEHNPVAFSNGFKKIITQRTYFEDNFGATKLDYKDLIIKGNDSVIMRDDLNEQFEKVTKRIKSELGIEISKKDFLNILKALPEPEDSSISSLAYATIKMIKNYNIDFSEIKDKFEFVAFDNLRDLETRLMILHLMGENPSDYFEKTHTIKTNELAARYVLLKEGKIPTDAMFLDKEQFKAQTGVKVISTKKEAANNRVEISKDFVKKAKDVSFGVTHELYDSELKTKKDGGFVIRNNDYLTYMLAEILGVKFKYAGVARGTKNVKVAEVLARFMAREDLQETPYQYYLDEESWQKLTKTKTSMLMKKYPLTKESVEMIIKQYLQLHPEEAFGKFKSEVKPVEKQETAQDLQTEKVSE